MILFVNVLLSARVRVCYGILVSACVCVCVYVCACVCVGREGKAREGEIPLTYWHIITHKNGRGKEGLMRGEYARL